MKFIKNKICRLTFLVFFISLCISIYASSTQTKTPKITELEGERIVFGKWGNKHNEFGIRWEDGLPFDGPAIQPAIDKEGNIYIVDALHREVKKFSIEGKHLLSFPSPPSSTILIDGSGNIYLDAGDGIKVFDKNGKFEEFISLKHLLSGKGFLLTRLTEDNNFLIDDLGIHKSQLISKDGKILKEIPYYEVKFDRKEKILKIHAQTRDKSKSIVEIHMKDYPIGKLSMTWREFAGKNFQGYLIVITRRLNKPRNYLILYLDEGNAIIKKFYVLPTKGEPTTTENPPVFGLDGNLYQSGFSTDLDNPSIGGYWVKRYIIPDEDKPR